MKNSCLIVYGIPNLKLFSFFFFFCLTCPLQKIQSLYLILGLNPVKVNRDDNWVFPWTRSFIFKLHYLDIQDKGMEKYGHPF